jgi:hypothetical protein
MPKAGFKAGNIVLVNAAESFSIHTWALKPLALPP